eukprot:tig00000480_g1340.t1
MATVAPEAAPAVEDQDAGEAVEDVPLVPVTIRLPNDGQVMFLVGVSESVMELRSHLEDSPEGCFYTQYHLEVGGKRIADTRLVCDILEPLEASGGFVDLVEDPYTERGARLHLARLRHIFQHPPVARAGGDAPLEPKAGAAKPPPQQQPAAQKGAAQKGKKGAEGAAAAGAAGAGAEGKKVPPSTSLERFFEALPAGVDSETRRALRPLPACVESLSLSGWNEVPGYRRLVGDLFYIDVSTLEGRRLCVTASVRGFFVNQSGAPPAGPFRPEPAPKPPGSSTLVGLLRGASPLFREAFAALVASAEELHPLQLAEYAGPPVPNWLAPPPAPAAHPHDPGRAEEALRSRAELEGQGRGGAPREWNEEFQSCVELPADSPGARMMRDRALHRVYQDFLRAAVQGAKEVGGEGAEGAEAGAPEGEAAAAGEPGPLAFYAYSNVFLSVARDDPLRPFRAAPAAYGEQATRVSSNHDLRAIRELLRLEPQGLHLLATALVDYGGRRVVAQSIIPGILHGQRAAQIKYGSTDRGATVAADPEFHAAAAKAAAGLYLGEHDVGIVGADGRKYLLDLTRLAPRDVNWGRRRTCRRRPGRGPRGGGAAGAGGAEARAGPAEARDPKSAPRRLERGVQCDLTDPVPEAPPLRFNADLLSGFRCAFGPEGDEAAGRAEEEAARALLREAAQFVTERVVPQLAAELSEGELVPLDGRMLVQQMHHHGLNVRYLGALAALCARPVPRQTLPGANGAPAGSAPPATAPASPHLLSLCELEMVSRAAKHALRRTLRSAPRHALAPAVALFLNCLFGRVAAHGPGAAPEAVGAGPAARAGKKKGKKGGLQAEAAAGSGEEAPSSAGLWAELRAAVHRKYRYVLPEGDPWEVLLPPKVAVLRALCKSVGVVLAAREYDLGLAGTPRPFRGEDVLDLVPVVKHLDLRHEEARRAMDAAAVHTGLGRLDAAYDALRAAADASFGVLGPLHPQNWHLLSIMGSTLYRLREVDAAAECHQRALLVAERCAGIDSPEALISLINLSNLQHMRGERETAAALMERALYLLLIGAGPLHPEVVQTYTHLAEMHGAAAAAASALKGPGAAPASVKAAGAGRAGGRSPAPGAAGAGAGGSEGEAGKGHALRCLHEAVQLNERLFGPVHPATAATYHALAVTMDGMGLHSLAVQHERRAVEVLERTFGGPDLRTLEARAYLAAFSKRADEAARALAALAGAPGAKPAAPRPGSGRAS